jgi:hypothetical protein
MRFTKFHDIWVRDFIDNFKQEFNANSSIVDDFFSFGHCYHFAVILKDLFNGEIMYNPTENHFATKINVETSWYANDEEMEDRLYDITGRIELTDEWVSWKTFCEEEPLESDRIKEQCIYKV